MPNNRDSFIFYRSFYEAIAELPKENQLELFLAISEFSLNFKEPKLSGLSKTIWILIKPQLEANIKKFHNGKKPKTKSKTEASEKQNGSKTEGNVNVNVNKNVNVNDNKEKEFILFWDTYHNVTEKPKTDKDATLRYWKKLTESEMEKAMESIESYSDTQTDKQFLVKARTYLNDKRFNDEFTKQNKRPVIKSIGGGNYTGGGEIG